MKTFDVTVERTVVQRVVVRVEAENRAIAREAAEGSVPTTSKRWRAVAKGNPAAINVREVKP